MDTSPGSTNTSVSVGHWKTDRGDEKSETDRKNYEIHWPLTTILYSNFEPGFNTDKYSSDHTQLIILNWSN